MAQIRRWLVKPPLTLSSRRGAVIVLPGRGIPAPILFRFCREMELRRTLFAAIEPFRLAWYPQPNGSNDQKDACSGLAEAVELVEQELDKFLVWQDLKKEETVLLGFSAGAVLALQIAIRSAERWCACVSLAGAILEPDKVPAAKSDTPIILQHNADDDCFKWFERYLPMRQALEGNGYNVTRLERPFGNHTLYINDAVNVSKLIAPSLGYPEGFYKRRLEPKMQRRG